MKSLNVESMENLNGGICVSPGGSGICLPCEALIGAGNAAHADGGLIACPL